MRNAMVRYNAETNYWSVRIKRGYTIFYAGNDENESREHLENNFRMAEPHDVDASLILKIHGKVPNFRICVKNDESIVITHLTSLN